ncbi:MAG: hypothetical protein EOS28_30845 [Mesorhizobium sp.]|uniref:hypothetical protein n=1 Tax=Mesorhizobium sp. TaxID=1871066 RepID=UPI000FE6C728|nr:hypothetical protein [Mesorhizobium sp.]RWB17874.1 MAG: hypothetical protein EOQ41_32840 [Mesorhizobium sp.]RWC38142.1 MAG: hypothetical protein EOS28_30845 [Mesorhizobium sp.]
MSQDLSLAQSHAFQLARTLMVPVTLFRSGDAIGVLPSAELEDDEVETLAEYDPFEHGTAH